MTNRWHVEGEFGGSQALDQGEDPSKHRCYKCAAEAKNFCTMPHREKRWMCGADTIILRKKGTICREHGIIEIPVKKRNRRTGR